MKARIVGLPAVLKRVLLSREVRPAEVILLRAIAVAVAAQLGIDVSHLLH